MPQNSVKEFQFGNLNENVRENRLVKNEVANRFDEKFRYMPALISSEFNESGFSHRNFE